jgi:hypothetical protein
MADKHTCKLFENLLDDLIELLCIVILLRVLLRGELVLILVGRSLTSQAEPFQCDQPECNRFYNCRHHPHHFL